MAKRAEYVHREKKKIKKEKGFTQRIFQEGKIVNNIKNRKKDNVNKAFI